MLDLDTHIIIAGTVFKLKAYEISYKDLYDKEGTGRDGNGDSFADFIATKRTLKVQIVPQTDDGVRIFLKAVSGGANVYFPVTCRDPREDSGAYSGSFYSGDRNVKALRIYQDGKTLWETSEVELVEE